MESCDHSEEILGRVSLVFVYLRTLFLPQFKDEKANEYMILFSYSFLIDSSIRRKNFLNRVSGRGENEILLVIYMNSGG